MKNQSDSELAQALAGDIEGTLRQIVETCEQVDDSSAEESVARGRKTILPSLVLWSGVVVGMLRGFSSQADVWRLVALDGLWNYPRSELTDQAVYNRLAKPDTTSLQRLFVRVRDGLQTRLAPFAQTRVAPFASGVFALDGSTLDKMARMLPSLREVPNGDSRLLAGKMVGLFDIRLQQWRDMIHLPNPNQNDKVAARELVQTLPTGSLILADLGFFSYPWFDWLTENDMYWLSRLRKTTSYEVVHTFYTDGDDLFDGLIWLGRHRADRAAHVARLVTYAHKGRVYRYITNVLDPKQLSLHEIAVLYARRWDIELAFKLLKRHLKLHLIWSAKPAVILQQLWAALIIAQFLHAIQLEIAGRAGVDPFDVSLDLITRYVPRLAQEGKDPVQMIVDEGRRVGFIRPSRRIRPQTPPIIHLTFTPRPESLVLTRQSRYAERRCQQQDLQELGARRIADCET